MGNLLEASTSKYILNSKNYELLESNLLEYSGLSKKQIRQKNVKVGDYQGEPIYVRTIIIGNKKFQKLVWIHGYAASGALFYKMMKNLATMFQVYFIDIVGMGGSSRPDNYLRFKFSPQDSIDYFVNYVEKWRQEMNNLKDFVLAGHSFGGYIAGNYAVKHHQHIKKLLMLSPIGIRVPEKDEKWEDRMSRRWSNGNGPPFWIRPAVGKVWQHKISPFTIGRVLGQTQTNKLIQGYVKSRQTNVSDQEEKQSISDYMYHILMRDGTSEYGIHTMFNPTLTAYLPLGVSEKLGSSEFPIPVSFFYGDEDWVKQVDEDAAQLCIIKMKRKHGIQSNYYTVPQAGHNMHMDNPKEFSKLIIMDVFSPEEENYNPIVDYN